MSERDSAEASAFALDRRNFDYLPDDQALSWRKAFLRTSHAKRIAAPKKLIIELLNACNLDCPICRVGQHGIKLDRVLPLATFAALIESLPDLNTVRLNGLGESTLVPDFQRYLDVLVGRDLTVELISNGSGDLPVYRSFLDAGGHLLISWDAVTPDIFERLRRPAKWGDYLRRFQQIAEARAEIGRGRISVIFTLQKANIAELPGVVALCSRFGVGAVQVNIAKTPSSRWVTESLNAIRAVLMESAEQASNTAIKLFAPDQLAGSASGVDAAYRTAGTFCTAPSEEAVIRWNGDVQTCNMFNPYTYGNIYRSPFVEIWTNRFAQLFRDRLNSEDRHPYCRDCSYMPGAYD